MPTFPTYDGELPKCLNPLNPRHYLLVLYWVFFRPTALKCYLYQASPEIYKSEETALKDLFSEPAYRNLIITGLLSAILIDLPFVYFLHFSNTLDQCSAVSQFNKLNAACHHLLLAISSHKLSSILEWIWANFLVLLDVLQGVVGGLILGFYFKLDTDYKPNITNRIAGGIALSISFGLVFSGVVGGVFSRSVLNLLVGLSLSVAFRLEISIWLVFVIVLIKIFYSGNNVVEGLFSGLVILIGVFRVPFFLLEYLLSFKNKENIHPVEWDELNVLRLPFASQYLLRQLQLDEQKGLNKISQTASNPFQIRVVRDSMWSYLEEVNSPIETIYNWFNSRWLEQYACERLKSNDPKYDVSRQIMLFADLVGTENQLLLFDSKTSELSSRPPEKLFMLVILLFMLLEEQTNKRIDIGIPVFAEAVELKEFLDDYKYGTEFCKSIFAIATYLNFQTLQQIAAAPTHLTWLNPTDTFLRPTVIQALQTLSTISQSAHRANIASSPLNQRNAILIANDALEQLTTYVTEQVHPNYPEQKLLLRIIDQWQSIITKAGGDLGRAELLEPVENPYIAGPPVTGSLFVGREDILTQLEELWLRPGQVESVVIFGHRRMGKTSILRNLPGRLNPTTRIINFNIQTLGTLNTAQLILALAQTLYDDLPAHILPHIPEPQSTDFPTPESDFRRWLKKLEPHRQPDDRFIIAIDEFELIEQGIQDGRLSSSLIGHWRGILNDFPWIIFAFAGLHTLQEMTQDYWNPLFGSVRKIPITFLTQPAATRLITNPSEDFPIDYDSDAIDLIYNLTNGQPYLTQLICQNLITRFNRQRFEEQREIEPRFTIADINTIITEPNFFNDGNAYFRGIWEQAQETHGEAQLAILRQLVDRPLNQTELADRTHHPIDNALKLLIEHDVIQPDPQDHYHYRVELMRQWVLRLQ